MLNQELLEHFYHSFKYKNVEDMIACYHDEIEFSDPAFGILKGNEAKSMWRMLLGSNSALTIDYQNISADADKGKAHWKAEYVFSKTNRKVINNVLATFEFKDGKIYKHKDSFDLHAWAKQALGFKAMLLSALGILQPSIQRKSRAALKAYMQKNNVA
ncbi:MAG: nuclear transport factor 2 family protein [Cytophaga sp.]|uniref:nuclear transport factor 2 family protein n=1 Tax=Cytophaga sp. TaxID=29535 RepID=UPI003F7D2312